MFSIDLFLYNNEIKIQSDNFALLYCTNPSYSCGRKWLGVGRGGGGVRG